MVGTKKPPTKLQVKQIVDITKPTTIRQEVPARSPRIKEGQERSYTFQPNDLESLFR